MTSDLSSSIYSLPSHLRMRTSHGEVRKLFGLQTESLTSPHSPTDLNLLMEIFDIAETWLCTGRLPSRLDSVSCVGCVPSIHSGVSRRPFHWCCHKSCCLHLVFTSELFSSRISMYLKVNCHMRSRVYSYKAKVGSENSLVEPQCEGAFGGRVELNAHRRR